MTTTKVTLQKFRKMRMEGNRAVRIQERNTKTFQKMLRDFSRVMDRNEMAIRGLRASGVIGKYTSSKKSNAPKKRPVRAKKTAPKASSAEITAGN